MSKLLFTSLLALAAVSALPSWYTDESEFLSAISASFYLEEFAEFQYGVQLNGSQTMWSSPGSNGYGWDASADLGLWSLDGAISTSQSENVLTVTFAGSSATAFGGIFFATDQSGFIVPATDVTVSLTGGP